MSGCGVGIASGEAPTCVRCTKYSTWDVFRFVTGIAFVCTTRIDRSLGFFQLQSGWKLSYDHRLQY